MTVHFKNLNELLAAIYFTAAFALICANASDLSSMLLCLIVCSIYGIFSKCFKPALFCLPLAAAMTVVNPLFNHTGNTPLFYVNDNPYTLEALLAGLTSAVLMLNLILWFGIAVKCIDSQRFFALMSKIFPTVSLMLSMIFKSSSDMKKRLEFTSLCQKGFLSEKKTLRHRIKSASAVLLASSANALESSVIKGVSMNARGFMNRKKTSVHKLYFRFDDAVVFLFAFALLALGFAFESTAREVFLCLSLCVPAAYQIKEELKWRYLRSKT